MEPKKELSLWKEQLHYMFRYEPGNEEEVLNSFVRLANEPDNNFDWFDAAVLSFQLSRNLVEEADQLLCSETGMEADSVESETPWFFP